MNSLPSGIWDNPTPDEYDSYQEFVEAWNTQQVSVLSYSYEYDVICSNNLVTPTECYKPDQPKRYQPAWIPGINLFHDQARGLVLALQCAEGKGNHLEDLSGQKNHAVVDDSTPVWGINQFLGNVLQSKAKVDSGTLSLGASNSPYTVCFWMKHDTSSISGGSVGNGINRQILLSQYHSDTSTDEPGFRFYTETAPTDECASPATQISNRVAADADDGNWFSNGSWNNTYTMFGKTSIVAAMSNDEPVLSTQSIESANAFYRFQNVTIPQGAYITCCYLYFTAANNNDDATTVNAKIKAEAIDNSSAPASYNDLENSDKTANTVLWSDVEAWDSVNGTDYYTSPDFSCVLQEVIDRDGWQSGNALTVYVMDNGTTSGAINRTPEDYSSSSSNAVKLECWYSYAGATVNFEIPVTNGSTDEQFRVAFDEQDGHLDGCTYHVAGTVGTDSSGNIRSRIYINGDLIQEKTDSRDLNTSSGLLGIGCGYKTNGNNDSSTDNNPFDGDIKDVRIYERELNLSEVKDIWSNGADLFAMPEMTVKEYTETVSGGVLAGGTADETVGFSASGGVLAGGSASVSMVGNFSNRYVMYPDGTVSTSGWYGTPEYYDLHLNIDAGVPYSDTTAFKSDTSDYITGLRNANCRLTLSNPRVAPEDTLIRINRAIYFYIEDTGGTTARLQGRLYIAGDLVAYDSFYNNSDWMEITWSGVNTWFSSYGGVDIPTDTSTGEPYTLTDFNDTEVIIDYVSGPSAVSIDIATFQAEMISAYFGAGGVTLGGSATVDSSTTITDITGGVVLGGIADPDYVSGVFVGGSGDYFLTNVITASGGVLTGGTAGFTREINPVVSGGVVSGGASTEDAIYNITASGGVLAGGASAESVTYNITASGGVTAGGSATYGRSITYVVSGGALVGGSAVSDFADLEETTGGLSAGGSATITRDINPVISGGLVASGAASVDSTYETAVTGGVVAGGLAGAYVSRTPTQPAAVVTGSTTTILFTYNETVSGGLVAGGTSKEIFNDEIEGTGGVIASGAASFDYTINHAVTGGVVAGGLAESYVSRSDAQPAAVVTGSTTTALFVYEHIVSGGIVVSGSAVSDFDDVAETAGGLSVGGSVAESFVYSIPASGGLLVSGAGFVQRSVTDFATGGVLVSGAASFDYTATHAVSGGVLVSGAATYNANLAGSATLIGEATASCSGTMIFAGSATLIGEGFATLDLQVKPQHILKELRTFILNESSVTDLISDRYYPVRLPQNATLPCVTYQRIYTDHLYDLTSAVGMTKTRLQLDCWSHDLSECKSIASALRVLLHGYSGAMSSVDCFNCLLMNEVHLHESPVNSSDIWLYHIALDLELFHSTSVPDF